MDRKFFLLHAALMTEYQTRFLRGPVVPMEASQNLEFVQRLQNRLNSSSEETEV